MRPINALAGMKGASRVGDSMVGSLEDVKAGARTADDLARIHQTSDGRFYLPDQPEDVLGSLTGNYDISSAKRAMSLQQIANGDPTGRMGRDLMIQKAKNGFELGPMWQDVADLNRGRRTTGFAPEHDPLGELKRAAPGAVAQQARVNSAYSPYTSGNVTNYLQDANHAQLDEQMADPNFGVMPTRRSALARQYGR